MLDSCRQIALAVLEAGESPRGFALSLSDALLEVEESRKIIEAMTGMAAAVAYRADVSPRTVFEQLFSMAPSDDLWQGIVETWREERDE